MSQKQQNLYLSLKAGESVLSLIPALNKRYGLSLDPNKYHDDTVEHDELTRLSGGLVSKETGELDWIVIDSSDGSGKNTVLPMAQFKNPKKLLQTEISRYSCIQINTYKEIEFLEQVSVGVSNNIGFNGSDAPRLLMELMNRYGIGSGWSCNHGRGNTTAGFTLLHLGKPETIPSEYLANSNVDYVAVVELETYTGKAVYSLTVGKL
ncbi:hypothetical protein PQC07_gp164 [Aeromonas phage D3]|uniref:Uncharacterized protein n=1 Tax=Aeromonas phage D3 TaxID=2593327 RepID=A0A514TVR0_9CAUD|nr:hypothetical protein PQC07_gp164 [Aeromonas phage D3]QDJ97109.1 hypothetical protein D3_0111 [Aeromonas phage D3]QEP52415.1 hypothetical protein D9_0208 [Aeromonas phage D9]